MGLFSLLFLYKAILMKNNPLYGSNNIQFLVLNDEDEWRMRLNEIVLSAWQPVFADYSDYNFVILTKA